MKPTTGYDYVDRFCDWAMEQAIARDPEGADYFNKNIHRRVLVSKLGSSAEGIDHAFLAGAYPCWGPRAEEFKRSSIGANEHVIVTAPYGPMPIFDPAELHVEACPKPFYNHDADHYIVTPRDLRPGTAAWEWFKEAVGDVNSLRADIIPTLLPESAEYTAVTEYFSSGYGMGCQLRLVPRLFLKLGDLGVQTHKAANRLYAKELYKRYKNEATSHASD